VPAPATPVVRSLREMSSMRKGYFSRGARL
jgi:hypothetical protein